MPSQRVALALYGAILMFCPPEFREEYGWSIRSDFARSIAEERSTRGPLAELAYALVAIWDLIATAFTEYRVLISRDFIYAFRALRRTPLFSAIIVATLAIAIGANVAVFSIMNAVVLAPLPYASPDRLVAMEWTDSGASIPTSLPDFADVMKSSPGTFSNAAAFASTTYTLSGRGEPRSVPGMQTTAGLFETLGIRPELGRFPTANEARAGAAKLVVLSDKLWRSAFAGDSHALGSIIRLDGVAYTVVGVAPADFQQPQINRGFAKSDAWTFEPDDGLRTKYKRFQHSFYSLLRLAPGVSSGNANGVLERAVSTLARRYPEEDATTGLTIEPLSESLVGHERDVFFAVFAAIAAVLLVACANVANLLLSRSVSREREFSIRIAVGASRGRIVTQLLVEAFVLAAIGGLAGIAIAYGVVTAFIALHPASIPRADRIPIDATAICFTIGIVAFCTVAAGLIPAISASRRDVATALKSAGRGGDNHRGSKARDAFVAAEIAMTLTLVVVAGLVIHSFIALTSQPLGFDVSRTVVVGNVYLPAQRYANNAALDAFYTRALAAAKVVPGVRNAAWSEPVPFDDHTIATTTTVVGRAYRKGFEPNVNFGFIGADYFRVLHGTLLAGRPLTSDDRAGAARAIVVNESFVRSYFPGARASDVIGKRVTVDFFADSATTLPPPSTIVGVVADLRSSYLKPLSPTEYLSMRQIMVGSASLLVEPNAGADPGEAVARAITAIDPLLAKPDVRQLSASLSSEVASQRLSLVALVALALIALVLAAAGIFAVVSFGVTQRTHEFGVRMALGAPASRVLWVVLLGALRLAAIGIVFGLLLAAVTTRLLGSQLFDTAPLDPLTLGVVTIMFVVAAIVAAFVPANRATRVDPIVALRYE